MQIIFKRFWITSYAALLYNPVSIEVLHFCYKISRVYSFVCNIILPLNTLLLSLLTWSEILLGAVIQIPLISCAHPWGDRDSSSWMRCDVNPVLALWPAVGFVMAFSFLFFLVFLAECKDRGVVREEAFALFHKFLLQTRCSALLHYPRSLLHINLT